MFRKLTKIGGVILVVLFVIATLAFTSIKYKEVACQEILVDYATDEVIRVDKDEIVRIVKATDSELLGKKFNAINAVKIEETVTKHDAVLQAEVYKTVKSDSNASYKGVLTVKIKHRKPVMRVMSSDGNYYLDALGEKIPTSSSYTANVLVTTGYFNEKYAREQLLPFVLHIESDPFWQAQIEQIHVSEKEEVILSPLIGNHIIEMGPLGDYTAKLRNMKAFSKQVLAEGNWNKYKTVSLKYKNQVVAKRK